MYSFVVYKLVDKLCFWLAGVFVGFFNTQFLQSFIHFFITRFYVYFEVLSAFYTYFTHGLLKLFMNLKKGYYYYGV